ncbi:hypothetical protein GTW43_12735 [Streptomyces sp. SID5785]|uniref:hypothetical protein n=1 Tax=Streptomyces sp. SID5785 TaxID=2690309 RepID=UPI001361738F|nr:hypothetical protein [Streptomyces sp. SID5785]MZD05946.1 hypothetical protein [Streptomyces sp. SID5785]
MTTGSTGAATTLELELHGPDPGPELDALHEALTAAGAARVERAWLTVPDSDQRVAELVEVTTLIVGGVGNVVAIVEAARQWIARRHEAAARRPAASPDEDAVPRVRVTIAGDTLELVHPADRATSEAIARFYDRHRPDGTGGSRP